MCPRGAAICLSALMRKDIRENAILPPFLQFRGASHLTQRTGRNYLATPSRCPFVHQTTFRIWIEFLDFP